jgi:hypothetical protein
MARKRTTTASGVMNKIVNAAADVVTKAADMMDPDRALERVEQGADASVRTVRRARHSVTRSPRRRTRTASKRRR